MTARVTLAELSDEELEEQMTAAHGAVERDRRLGHYNAILGASAGQRALEDLQREHLRRTLERFRGEAAR